MDNLCEVDCFGGLAVTYNDVSILIVMDNLCEDSASVNVPFADFKFQSLL